MTWRELRQLMYHHASLTSGPIGCYVVTADGYCHNVHPRVARAYLKRDYAVIASKEGLFTKYRAKSVQP